MLEFNPRIQRSAPRNPTKGEQQIPHLSRLEQDEELGPDVSVLEKIGRTALIDTKLGALQLDLAAA